ncbi:hypothetical protein FGIG_06299 [Fasciola gigantica]|uniref:Uncharacterized protein n=1 Tax=Fasciola gigantica TaxID=46835 RepID=A0A504YX84_FASGI|nr:hypothetical protein FGIG_06299 [Fasciola gigantica]
MLLSVVNVRTPLRTSQQVLPDLLTDPITFLKSPCKTRNSRNESSSNPSEDETAIQLQANGLTQFCGSSRQPWPNLEILHRPSSGVFTVSLYCEMMKRTDWMKRLEGCLQGPKSPLNQSI